LIEALTRLGFDVLPSSANFVFTRHPIKARRWLLLFVLARFWCGTSQTHAFRNTCGSPLAPTHRQTAF
jgi:histidinol-phosphate/aromatic aminotransferase/cobyric acid decarboxylase-like protein